MASSSLNPINSVTFAYNSLKEIIDSYNGQDVNLLKNEIGVGGVEPPKIFDNNSFEPKTEEAEFNRLPVVPSCINAIWLII